MDGNIAPLPSMSQAWTFTLGMVLLICVDISSHAEYQNYLLCEGDSEELTCPDDLVLAITGVFYGRYDLTTCLTPDQSTLTGESNCSYTWAANVIGKKCLRQKKCTIMSEYSSISASDPCPGVSKYLEVEYKCVQESSICSLTDLSPSFLDTSSSGLLTSPSFPSSAPSGSYTYDLIAPEGYLLYLHLGHAHLGEPDCTSHNLSLVESPHDVWTFCHHDDLPTSDLKFNNVSIVYYVKESYSGTDFLIGYEVRGCTKDNIPTLSNASLVSTVPGLKVTFRCQPGFVPSYDIIINCQEDTWSSPTETCQRKSCGIVSTITNGQVSQNDGLFGSTATYRCIPGFKLIGVKTRMCLANGNWSDSQPQCKRIVCFHPGIPENGFAEPDSMIDYPIETVVTFSCKKGFTLFGASKVVCDGNGSWNQSTPTCTEVNCGIPLKVKNAIVTYNSTKPWGVAEYVCKEGFIMEGNNITWCNINGSWSDISLPSCKASSIEEDDSIVTTVTSTTKAISTFSTNDKWPPGIVPGLATVMIIIFLILLWVTFVKCFWRSKEPIDHLAQTVPESAPEPLPLESSTDWYDEGFTYAYSQNISRAATPIAIIERTSNGYHHTGLTLTLDREYEEKSLKRKKKKHQKVTFLDEPVINSITSLPSDSLAYPVSSIESITLSDGEDQAVYSTDL